MKIIKNKTKVMAITEEEIEPNIKIEALKIEQFN